LTNPVAKALLDSRHGQEEAKKLNQLIQQLSRQTESESEEVLEIGPFTFQAKASKFMENDQLVGTVIVLRDITRLQEVDRLKTEFVSQVSHELRTPMSNIKLYLSLLKRGKAEKYDSYMLIIERETQRLERLISDLLDISRIDYARRTATLERLSARERVDVNPIIEQVVVNYMPQARLRQITLRQDLAAELPQVLANRDQIIQVLTNLVGNAIVYTLDSGEVTMRSYTHESPPGQQWVVTEVADTGIGIPPEDQAHIFERFYRGTTPEKLNPPGTGLGLAITKEIVELHHGFIELDSHVGQGSTFRVYLPVVQASANGTTEETVHV
jgi:signal transduction histidine kinase